MLQVSYDSKSWWSADFEGNHMPLPKAGDGLLPELPDGYVVSHMLLPVELLLSRSFSLPLSHPKFIDEDILGQELNERTGEEADNWLLAWQAAKTEHAVAGLVFGLPESLRTEIDNDERWQPNTIGVDAWERLQMRLHYGDTNDAAGDPVAVFDADSEGVFFGVWEQADDKAATGVWRGMRRLNQAQGLSHEEMATQIKRSLLAMGWHEDGMAIGRLGLSLFAALGLEQWHGDTVEDGSEQSELVARHAANLTLSADCGLNFRHGRWTAQSDYGWLRPWRRAMALAATIMLVWVLGSAWQIHLMDVQAEQYRQRITDAFHKGLPDEPVMIDAIAQLRRAASGGVAGTGSAGDWLRQLAAINRVHKKTPWRLQELSMSDGAIKMSGKADDLESLNKIRQALQLETAKDVTLADTDLSGQQVSFRIHWQ